MIDSIDLNQADKDLQEELNIEFPDPSKNYLATGEVNGDVENEDGPTLSDKNYYSTEADWHYMSVSQYKILMNAKQPQWLD